VKRLLVLVALLALPRVAAAQQAETIEYYGQDVIGSIRIVYDANGNVIGRQDFTPFGTPVQVTPPVPKEGFGGQEKDDEANEAYFHARMLQTRLARFGSPDPVESGVEDPQLWNRYAYASNRPLWFVDPTGLMVFHSSSVPGCVDHPSICDMDEWLQSKWGEAGAGSDPWGGSGEGWWDETAGMFSGGPARPTNKPTTSAPSSSGTGSRTEGNHGDNTGGTGGNNRPTIAPTDRQPDNGMWDAFKAGCEQGALAMLDGADPFGTPFADRNSYNIDDPSTPGLTLSRDLGGWSLQYVVGLELSRALAAATSSAKAGSFLYKVGHNRWVRVGEYMGQPRIAIGGGEKADPAKFHLPLVCFGK
jgi:RHS repeat-associated protein